nr:MAG TPA: hypothetical protein [Caudoviricetes sp.]
MNNCGGAYGADFEILGWDSKALRRCRRFEG